MARERMITRTIKSACVEVMSINTTTAEVRIECYATEPQENEEKYLKVLRKDLETDTFKLVKIERVQIYENLYGMSEKEFIQHAKLLPNR